MPTTNEKFIAWLGQRMQYGKRPQEPWSRESEDWIETEPHGNDPPPDPVLLEISFRLSLLGDTYLGPGAFK